MSLELMMLGTGHAMVTKYYNTCFLIKKDDKYLMVDAGGGNQVLVQLEKLNVDIKNIHNMIITHGHTDHVLGVIWMIRTITSMMIKKKYRGKFNIYCHDEVKKIVETFCEMTLPKKLSDLIGDRVVIHEMKDGEQAKFMGMRAEFFDIQSKKMKQFGFKLHMGGKKTLVCLGDEPYNSANEKYAKNCDWMLSEAFCLYEDRDIYNPYKISHSTALDAGNCAEALGIKNLVLYHTEDRTLANRKLFYTREAKSVFSGNVFVPEDLEKIKL